MSQLVAVYGTLKRGYGNHRWAEADGAEFVSEGHTDKRFWMFDGPFPRVIDNGSDGIAVEVFKIPDKPINMDMLEGHPSHFKRELVEVYLRSTKEKQEAWMYLYQYPTEGMTLIQSGKWEG